jgi:glycosyltransferase involved in cell wall biosynthesis
MAVMQVPVWLAEDKPDVVLMIQDLWNLVNYLGYMPREMPTVGYYPVDTPNMKWSYAMGAAALTEAVPYTWFGAHETALGVRDVVEVVLTAQARMGADLSQEATWLQLPKDKMELHMRMDRLAALQNVDGYRPIPHGIDHALFTPLPKWEARAFWNFPQDAFIVQNVGTNQFRKRQDITIRAFAELAKQVPEALLVLHCMGGKDKEGWDLAQLSRLYGVEERVICTHWTYPNLTDAQLRALYSCADVHLNTSGGEGWSLCTVESALCGVPQLVPDWSATRELWTGVGVLLPVLDYRFEPKYLNTAHAVLDVSAIAARLVHLAHNRDEAAAIGAACRVKALSLPSWEQVGGMFAERIEDACAAAKAAPASMMLEALRHGRRGELASELL